MYYYAVSKLKLESMKKIVKLEVRRNTIASIRNSMRTEFGSRISRKWLTNRWTSIWNSKGGVKLFLISYTLLLLLLTITVLQLFFGTYIA
jgi:hypothetical protein